MMMKKKQNESKARPHGQHLWCEMEVADEEIDWKRLEPRS